jgi:hypothetical protein
MIKIENTTSNVLKVTVPATLKADDFKEIAPEVEKLIQKFGKIRLLLDASVFNGWENVSAFDRHMEFVKIHNEKIERIAVIAGHAWQHWIASLVKMIIHPEMKVYDKGEEQQAAQWLIAK